MKKIQNKFRVMFNAMIAAVLGMFGITSCGGQVFLYGTAMPAHFVDLEGEVTNEEGEPLESMQVIVSTAKIQPISDTLYTNAEGEFSRYFNGIPDEGNDTLLIIVNDTTDVYESEKLQFPFSEMTKEAESAWATEYSVDVKVQLKKK